MYHGVLILVHLMKSFYIRDLFLFFLFCCFRYFIQNKKRERVEVFDRKKKTPELLEKIHKTRMEQPEKEKEVEEAPRKTPKLILPQITVTLRRGHTVQHRSDEWRVIPTDGVCHPSVQCLMSEKACVTVSDTDKLHLWFQSVSVAFLLVNADVVLIKMVSLMVCSHFALTS